MPFPGVTYINELPAAVLKELEQFASLLEGYLRKEHKADGSHGAITADSLTTTDAITSGGEGTFDGNVTADADGNPVEMGTLAAAGGFVNVVNGLDARSTTASRWRIGTTTGTERQLLVDDLLGTAGTNGFTLRVYFDGTNYVLDHDAGVAFQIGTSVFARRLNALYTRTLNTAGAEVQGGVISPSQIVVDQHNYNPTGLSTASVVRLTVDAAHTITGLAAQTAGTRITLINVTGGAGFDISLAHADTVNSVAANVFICPAFAAHVIRKGGAVDVWYDGDSSVWRVLAS